MKTSFIATGLFVLFMMIFTLLLWIGGWNFERNPFIGLYFACSGGLSLSMTIGCLVSLGKV